jgi:hypothetical protein
VAVASVLAGKVSGGALVLPIGGRNIDARLHERIVAEGEVAPAALARAA